MYELYCSKNNRTFLALELPDCLFCSHLILILFMVLEPSSIPTMAFSLLASLNIFYIFSSPMERNTYLSWKSQFEDMLDIHNLKNWVSSQSQPDIKLSDGKINLAYTVWRKIDKIVLKATVTPSV